MPRESKVAPATRRQWLEDQEQGVPIAKIASGSGRSARTVTSHIELARQEKAHREVRSGLIREAYQRHYNDLMELAQTLRRNGHGAAMDRRTTLLREALQRHIPKSPLWQACNEWEEAARKSDLVTESIKGYLTPVVERGVHGRFPEVNAEGFRESLLYTMRVTAEEGSLSNMIYSTGREEPGHSASWGQFQLCETVPDEKRLADILELHQKLVGEVVGSGYVKQMKTIADQGAKAREMVDREVEMLILSHMVPGACPLCPGDEVARARGRRKGL